MIRRERGRVPRVSAATITRVLRHKIDAKNRGPSLRGDKVFRGLGLHGPSQIQGGGLKRKPTMLGKQLDAATK